MRKIICPITNQILDCQKCQEIKDNQVCILWEPEEFMNNWAMKLARLLRKRIKTEDLTNRKK